MANKKITQFTETLSASSEAVLAIVDGGVNYKIKPDNLITSSLNNNPSIILNDISLNIGMRNQEPYVKTYDEFTIGETNISYRNGFVEDELPTYNGSNVVYDSTIPSNEVIINNLFINVNGFELIENLNPRIILSRYKPKEFKDINTGRELKGEYKTSVEGESLRPTTINLTTGSTYIDFGQEYYFKVNKNKPRGYSKNIKRLVPTYYNGFIYFEIKIGITLNGDDYYSKPLKRFKLELRDDPMNGRKYIIIRETSK